MKLCFRLPWDDEETERELDLDILYEIIFEEIPELVYEFAIDIVHHYYKVLHIMVMLTYYCVTSLITDTLSFFCNTTAWLFYTIRQCRNAYAVYLLCYSIEKVFFIALQKPWYFVLIAVTASGFEWFFDAMICPGLARLNALDRVIELRIVNVNRYLTQGGAKRKAREVNRKSFVERGTQTESTTERVTRSNVADKGTQVAGTMRTIELKRRVKELESQVEKAREEGRAEGREEGRGESVDEYLARL